jgi:hypothetical protein
MASQRPAHFTTLPEATLQIYRHRGLLGPYAYAIGQMRTNLSPERVDALPQGEVDAIEHCLQRTGRTTFALHQAIAASMAGHSVILAVTPLVPHAQRIQEVRAMLEEGLSAMNANVSLCMHRIGVYSEKHPAGARPAPPLIMLAEDAPVVQILR